MDTVRQCREFLQPQGLTPDSRGKAAVGDDGGEPVLARLRAKDGGEAVEQGLPALGEGRPDHLEEEILAAGGVYRRDSPRLAPDNGGGHLRGRQEAGGGHVKEHLRLGVVLHVYRECAVVPRRSATSRWTITVMDAKRFASTRARSTGVVML